MSGVSPRETISRPVTRADLGDHRSHRDEHTFLATEDIQEKLSVYPVAADGFRPDRNTKARLGRNR